ncbi:MAG: DsbA family protein [Gammaproteobacteria bacterium]|nr:DsbA family protein [Gammaproteobacteria bacterium]
MLKRWLYSLCLAITLLPALAAAVGCGDETQPTPTGCTDDVVHSGALFNFDGVDFGESDLDLRIREKLYELAIVHYREQEQLMDSALWQIYLSREAERQQKDPQQLAMTLFNLSPPTEQAMNAFYQANKEKIVTPYEQVKPQVAQFLLQQQMLEQRAKLIDKIKNEGRYALLITKPQPPIAMIDTEGFPSKGSLLAPVEVVEFADYQCPHCKTAAEVMQRLEKRYADKLRVIFMDFPINRSGISRKIAEGAVCADQQGKFWEYHNTAFELQSSLSADTPLDLANRLGLDIERYATCLQSPDAGVKVTKAKTEALRLGLDSTPSFFVNGIHVNVHSNLEQELSQAIDLALKGTGS